jgi:hypothetical protein
VANDEGLGEIGKNPHFPLDDFGLSANLCSVWYVWHGGNDAKPKQKGEIGKVEKPKQKAEIWKAEMGQSRLQTGAPDFCFLLSRFLLFPHHSIPPFTLFSGPPEGSESRWIKVNQGESR